MNYIILFLAILIFHTGSAQDPQLAGVDWYLHDLVINGEHYPPPRNPEVQNVVARFQAISNGDGVDGFISVVCNAITGLVEYGPNTPDFSFQPPLQVTLIDCNLQINEDYEVIYFPFFDQSPGNLYVYSITTGTNGHKTLELTSHTADWAIYGDHILSSEDFHKTQFAIHPNPAKNELFITSKNTTGNLSIKILNIAGKLLSKQDVAIENQTSIDISSLTSGIYFLKIKDENGNTTIKKFIKQ
jgi:hypothetical protein